MLSELVPIVVAFTGGLASGKPFQGIADMMRARADIIRAQAEAEAFLLRTKGDVEVARTLARGRAHQ